MPQGLLGLVRWDLPRSPSGLRKLESEDPKLHEQLRRIMELCTSFSTLVKEEREDLFVRSFLGHSDQEENAGINMYQLFLERLRILRKSMRVFLRPYLTPEYLDSLMPKNRDKIIADPTQLLLRGFAEMPESWKPTDEDLCLAFEARRDFILTLLNFVLTSTKRVGAKYDRQDTDKLKRFLVENKIITSMPEALTLRSLHDPKRLMRTVWIEKLSQVMPDRIDFEERRTRLCLAELSVSQGRTIPVIIHVRRKGFLQIIGKMLAVSGSGVQNVEDRRGICFAYPTIEDLRVGAAFVRQTLPLTDFITGDEGYRENVSGNQQPVNTFSASGFVSCSYYRMVAGHRVQIQHRRADQHLDLIHSRGPENHTLYHLRQYAAGPPECAPGLFFWLFPTEIYKIRWNSQSVLQDLVNQVLTSLPK